MRQEHHYFDNTSLVELEADRRHYAAVVIELADQVTVLAKSLAVKGRDSDNIFTLSDELGTVQGAIDRSLTKLNNATVQEYMVKERDGMV